jgi:hypothetical protein
MFALPKMALNPALNSLVSLGADGSRDKFIWIFA